MLKSALIFILFVGCTSSGVKNGESFRSRTPASQLRELKLKTTKVAVDTYDVNTDLEARKWLRSLLATSKTAAIQDYYREDRAARLYHTFSYVRKAAKDDSEHVAHRLSDGELTAIIHYSHDGFEPMNKALWTQDFGENPREIEYPILGLLSALQHLAKYDGKVLRGEFGKGEQIKDLKAIQARYDSFQKDKPFVLAGFWSSTRGESVTARGHFINYSPIVYKIHSLSGRGVESLSLHGSEEEVLFSPLTKFKFLSKQKVSRDEAPTEQYPYDFHYEIELQEID